MKIYIRKIDKQCVEKQISYTKEILIDFFDNQADHSTITCIGKNSGQKVKVALLLATDPRFDNSMQRLLNYEGNLCINDLMVMYKIRKEYIVELVKPTDNEYNSYLNLFNNERHLLISMDDLKENVENLEYNDIFDHNVYGIHIKKLNDALSKERPHICIGWSTMGDLSDIKTKDDLTSKYNIFWPNDKSKTKGQNIGQIWRFVKEMQIGDYVVFADDNLCHIGRVTSDYYFDSNNYSNQSPDYANVRDVQWLKTDINRSELSTSFHHSLSAVMSIWGLNDYKSAIYDLLTNNYKKDNIDYENESSSSNYSEEQSNIFDGFSLWLTSYNNPDYTGNEKYEGYSRALEHLVQYMQDKGYIVDSNLNDKNIEKYNYIKRIYEENDDVQEFDEKKNSAKAGIAALKKYIKYIEYLLYKDKQIETKTFDYSATKDSAINKIFFGTPGCGKSYYIEHNILGKDDNTKEYIGDYNKENIIRTTFYQDYSNTDFVGQILPKISKDENGKEIVEYIFNPGPFTLALIQAIKNPDEKIALVIEEINRGNAPAIFGDIFQLLDRDNDGISEYGIVNVSIIDYLNSLVFDVNDEKTKYLFSEIKIPGNMYIFATMNTSDQNVYTLDTAFIRRWEKVKIKNSFENCSFASTKVPGMENYSWKEFVESINACIASHLDDLQVNEDKQLGAYFVKEKLLTNGNAEKFAYKVFDYLWSDVSKLDHSIFFNDYDTFEALVLDYLKKGVGVFKPNIFKEKELVKYSESEEDKNE